MRSMYLLPFVGAASAKTIPLMSRAATSWTYQGCYLDSTSQRTLAHSSGQDYSDQTVETCTSYCQANGFNYAGLEYGQECWCDYQLSGATQEPDSDCSMQCNGDPSEICGNGNRLSVYYNGNTYTGPSTNPGPPGWTYLACFTDNGSARTLRTSQGVSAGADNMTVAECTDACKSSGYSMAGLEYSRECWCDDAIQNGATVAQSGCSSTCSGNSTEYCGGSNRINVYQVSSTSSPGRGGAPTGWTALGCFTDNASSRTLESSPGVAGGASNMSIEGCLSVCSSQGFAYGGVEYAQECFCGNSLQNSGGCATDQTTCYQPCRGNSAEICGGPNRLNVFYAGSDPAVSACSASGSSTTASSTASATSTTLSTLTSTSTTSVSSSTSSVATPSTSSVVTSSSTSSASPTSSSTSSIQSTSSSTSSISSSSSSVVITTTSTTTQSTTTTSKTSTSTSPVSTVCPSFWANVVSDLASQMRDSNGQCNNLARAAIRYAFHDAATFSTKLPTYAPASGGADGSLLLSPDEINRPDNAGLHDYHATIGQKLASYQAAGYPIGAADLIQVAGALGVKACPGGQIGRVLVGRTDTNISAPDNLLPQAFGPGSDHDTIYQLFSDKGFGARDLAALLGAHSTSIANFETANGIPQGTPQDDTPGLWDVAYYNQTYYPVAGMARFDSDVNLSKNVSSAVGKQFKSFVGNQGAWGASFSSAYQLLSLLGITSKVQRTMQDCSTLVANAFPS